MAEIARMHSGLTIERWRSMTVLEQLGNIGSEIGRAVRAKAGGNTKRMWSALERALELFDLTVADPKLRHRLKEICRSREVALDFLVGDNAYGSSAEDLERYFTAYARLQEARASAAPCSCVRLEAASSAVVYVANDRPVHPRRATPRDPHSGGH